MITARREGVEKAYLHRIWKKVDSTSNVIVSFSNNREKNNTLNAVAREQKIFLSNIQWLAETAVRLKDLPLTFCLDLGLY